MVRPVARHDEDAGRLPSACETNFESAGIETAQPWMCWRLGRWSRRHRASTTVSPIDSRFGEAVPNNEHGIQD